MFGRARLHNANVPICYPSTFKNVTVHHQHSTQQHELWICHGSSRATSKGCQSGKTNDESETVCPGGLAGSGKLADHIWIWLMPDFWCMWFHIVNTKPSIFKNYDMNLAIWGPCCAILCVWDWWHAGNRCYFDLWFRFHIHMNLKPSTPPGSDFPNPCTPLHLAPSSGQRWHCRVWRAGAPSCLFTPCGSCSCASQVCMLQGFQCNHLWHDPLQNVGQMALAGELSTPRVFNKKKAGQSLNKNPHESQPTQVKVIRANWSQPTECFHASWDCIKDNLG